MRLKKWLAAGTVAFVALLLITAAVLAGSRHAKPAHVASAARVVLGSQVLAPAAAAAVTTATESENSGESESETATEPPGEPTPGHEDPQGVDVNHDCSPENPSGCDTANGEQP